MADIKEYKSFDNEEDAEKIKEAARCLLATFESNNIKPVYAYLAMDFLVHEMEDRGDIKVINISNVNFKDAH